MSRRHRVASWLAILAMALNALWPLLAQAKPRSVTLVPLCTIGGETHYAEVPLGKTPLEQKSSAQGEHCSYCALSALPPAPLVHVSEKSSPSGHARVECPLVEPEALLEGRPRAPPALS
jgi:hypothetical protein